MKQITNVLYKITRKLGRIASISNDIDNTLNGRVDRVANKRIKRKAHQTLNKILRKF